ncbi:MAG: type II toxin-antitoxin system RelE/ParE family toxin [Treponema sp.]|nr:type II toxin-antitoxin system RelE/ParE family toxin [Treponema sp.]
MAYNVRIMEKAEEDLSEIVDSISDTLKNQKAADNLLVGFLQEKDNIAENPYMYPLSDNPVLQNEGYHRFLFYRNFIALYLIDDVEKIVSIMRILYAKRDYANLI